MTVTVHAAGSSGTTDLNSHNTASFTPAANSRLYAACLIMRSGHSTTPSWSDPGGGLTWTPHAESSFYSFEGDANYAVQVKTWRADIGGSPSSTSLTFAPGTSGGAEYGAWVVWSQTNDEFNTGSPYPQAAVTNGADVNPSSGSANGTLTLGSAPASGSKCFAVFAVGDNTGGGPSTPSGWTLVNTLMTDAYVNVNLYSRTGSTGTTAQSTDLGGDVGNWAGVIFEVAGVGGPAGQDITGTVGGIASGEAFGTAQINRTMGPLGNIASEEAFGSAVITGAGGTQAIIGAGNIAGAEAFGSTSVLPQGRTLTGVGNIASAESFLSSDTGQTLSWAAVSGATGYRLKWGTSSGGPYTTGSEDTGDVTTYNVVDLALTPGVVYYMVVVPLDGATEGSPSVERVVVFGAAAVVTSNTITPTGIATAEAFGTANAFGGQVVIADGIASGEAFGTAALTTTRTITGIGGIAGAEAFGSAAVNTAAQTFLTGVGAIGSAEAFGTAALSVGPTTLTGVGAIESGAQFGADIVYFTASGPPTTKRRMRYLPHLGPAVIRR